MTFMHNDIYAQWHLRTVTFTHNVLYRTHSNKIVKKWKEKKISYVDFAVKIMLIQLRWQRQRDEWHHLFITHVMWCEPKLNLMMINKWSCLKRRQNQTQDIMWRRWAERHVMNIFTTVCNRWVSDHERII
jgi:hypothetical protein